MGTNCAPLVADLFLYCYERDFMDSLNHDNQADVIEAFNSTSRYLDDLLNIDNPYFEGMVNQIYPPEIQLNKANISDTEAPLFRSTSFCFKWICYDKRDDFDFDIVNFPFLDGDVPRRASYGVYISQLIRFARVCNHVTDFNARNKCLTAKLLQQGYRYHKLRKTFSKFYSSHYELISKYNVGLKTLLSEGLSETEFYGDLVYKFKKLIGSNDFSFQFRKIITLYRRIGYNLNVMRLSACLVFNPIMVDNYAAFFNCTPVGQASRLYDGPDLKLFILVGWDRSFLSVAWPTGVQLVFFFCSGVSRLFGAQADFHRRAAYSICESWFLIYQDVYRDLFVCS